MVPNIAKPCFNFFSTSFMSFQYFSMVVQEESTSTMFESLLLPEKHVPWSWLGIPKPWYLDFLKVKLRQKQKANNIQTQQAQFC